MQAAVVIKFLAFGAANGSNSARAVMALVVVGRADASVSLAESLASQKTLVVIGNAVFAADWSVGVGAALAFGIVDEARAFLLELDALALQNTLVVVSLIVDSANRSIIARAINAVVFIRAFAITLQGNATALTLAFVEVGLAINTAFGLVDLGAVLAVGVIDVTETVVTLPNSLAV